MPEFYKYITCPNCKTEVQYIDQYIHYSETSQKICQIIKEKSKKNKTES